MRSAMASSSLRMYKQPLACPKGVRPFQAASHAVRRPSTRASCAAQATVAAYKQQTIPLLGGHQEDALLLAWFASKNRSVFATQCFVETVLECYKHGAIVDELEMALQLRSMQAQPPLLRPLEQDVLHTWILLIMLTLRHLGVPFTPSSQAAGAEATPADDERSASNAQASTSSSSSAGTAAAGGEDSSRKEAIAAELGDVTKRHTQEVMGLLQHVRGILRRYVDEGYDLLSVQALHYMVNRSPQPGQSMFQELMQQYTVLVLCTLEVAAALQLPMKGVVMHELSVTAPLGYVTAFSEQHGPAPTQQQQQQGQAPLPPVRSAAVRLLVAFMGAVLDSDYSKQRFVEYAAQAYDAGISAAEIYQALEPQEFKELGLLLPAASPDAQGEDKTMNATLFAQWLSIVYMTFAQLGVVFPAAATAAGVQGSWAWAGAGDEVEANNTANFVAGALKRAPKQESPWPEAQPDDPLAAKLRAVPEAAQALEESQRAVAEEMREKGTLRGKPVPPLVRLPDPELGAKSQAMIVFRQRVELVDAAKKLVLSVLEQQEAEGQSAVSSTQAASP